MKNKPLVTVIIPAYNNADKVGAAIKSVAAQTYDKIQLIVVDDGSDDNTGEVVSRFPYATYLRQEHAGQAAARNRGLREARGSLIASLDSDDTWYPGFLTRCVAKLEEDKLDFVFANWLQRRRDQVSRDYLRTFAALAPFIKKAHHNWVDMNHAELKYLYLRSCPSPSSSILMRGSSIVSGWNPGIRIGDDWCLLLDMILNKECRAAFSLERLWTKHVHDYNIYDGRAWNEVMELLYVNDLTCFLNRYRHVLARDEIKALAALHQKGLLNLAVYQLFKKGNIRLSLQLVNRSLTMNAGQTIRLFPDTLKTCLSLKRGGIRLFPANPELSTQQ